MHTDVPHPLHLRIDMDLPRSTPDITKFLGKLLQADGALLSPVSLPLLRCCTHLMPSLAGEPVPKGNALGASGPAHAAAPSTRGTQAREARAPDALRPADARAAALHRRSDAWMRERLLAAVRALHAAPDGADAPALAPLYARGFTRAQVAVRARARARAARGALRRGSVEIEARAGCLRLRLRLSLRLRLRLRLFCAR
jgi:hypothetical protein